MSFDPSVYNDEWFEYLSRFDEYLKRAMFGCFSLLGKPNSLLDVGCGTGAAVMEASECGVTSVGMELVFPSTLKRYSYLFADFVEHDLREPLDMGYSFDMVFCWEVAEHLPEESADALCDTLGLHTKNWLVFTAAHEGQGGQYHLNEQDSIYWIKKMEDRGFLWDSDKTDHLEEIWKWTTGPCHWLPENVLVFWKGTSEDENIFEAGVLARA